MVNSTSHDGLIIAQTSPATPLAEEIVAICDWPLLLQPTMRELFKQIEVLRPECLLFWLELENEISRAAELVVRLRERGPRPYRIAAAHCLSANAEHTFRSAGVHSYFAVNGNIRALVEDALLPLVDLHRATTQVRGPQSADRPTPIRGPAIRASPATMRPP